MQTFLNIVAEDMSEIARKRYNEQCKDMTVIFPNKRASLFFNQHLIKYIKPPFWAPTYSTISELFQSLSPLTIADPLLLIYYLYKAYQKVTGSDENFDRFYSWGEVLLNDFEDIDNNMVDADKLFINITDIETLTGFDYIDNEQEEAIRKLFNSFNTATTTELHRRYLNMWNAMPEIYKTFKNLLREQNYAYTGMMKREVAEKIRQKTLETDYKRLLETNYKHTFIVGFNVLNETEKTLFKYLKDCFEVCFYWDYDEAYKNSTTFEAAQFISENIKLFGNKLAGRHDVYNNLKTDKNISFVSSVTDNAQCRYIGKWLDATLNADEPLNNTAVVLCDEHILLPVLHSIPSTYDETKKQTVLNITMGYPMQETPVASFVTSLLELVFRGWKEGTEKNPIGKWRYTYAEKVLKHPYTLLMNKKCVLALISNFKRNNIMYPSQDLFQGKFIEDVFSKPAQDIQTNLRHITEILQTVAIKISEQKGNINLLYAESIYNTWTMLNHFCDLIEQHGLVFETPETLIRLVRQTISSKNIAFHGEPAIGLQLMGILETRNLDFENVIMLSVNEGMMPKSTNTTTFILNFLREANGMTTIKRQISLYAYYFYRLLQRAKHITLVYNNATKGLHRGEMSRFMMQLKYEKNAILSENTQIKEYVLSPDFESHNENEAEGVLPFENLLQAGKDGLIKINKSTEIVSKALNTINKVSPTALNTYLDCQLRFYLQYVCGFRQEDEVNEDIADNVFGSIFHNAMERFYNNYKHAKLSNEFYSKYINEDEIFTKSGHDFIRRCVDKAFAKEMFNATDEDIDNDKYISDLNGTQMLNHEVIARYVEKQIINDYKTCPLIILNQEKEYYNDFRFNQNGIARTIRIGGKIDREDIVTIEGEQRHRIVDYKTSTAAHGADSIEDLFTPAKNRAGYILQAFYYSEVMMLEADKKGIALEPIMPALSYIKLEKKTTIKLGKESVINYQSQCHQVFAAELEKLLAEIFDVKGQFVQADNDYHCNFCPFKVLCNKATAEIKKW